jgi:hypothetical protein
MEGDRKYRAKLEVKVNKMAHFHQGDRVIIRGREGHLHIKGTVIQICSQTNIVSERTKLLYQIQPDPSPNDPEPLYVYCCDSEIEGRERVQFT